MEHLLQPSQRHGSWNATDYFWDDVQLVAEERQKHAVKSTLNNHSDDGNGFGSAGWVTRAVTGVFGFEGTAVAEVPGASEQFSGGGDRRENKLAGYAGGQRLCEGVTSGGVPGGEQDAAKPESADAISPFGGHTTKLSLRNNPGAGLKVPPEILTSRGLPHEELSIGLSDEDGSGSGFCFGPSGDLSASKLEVKKELDSPLQPEDAAAAYTEGSDRGALGRSSEKKPTLAVPAHHQQHMHAISTRGGNVKTNLACRIDGCMEICDKAYTARSRVCLKHMQAGGVTL